MAFADQQIIEKFRKGHISAFETFFDKYKRPLGYFVNSLLPNKQEIAEEIVSDCFVKLWNKRQDFESETKLKAFLYIVAKNACFSHLKSARYRQYVDIDSISENAYSEDPEIVVRMLRAETMELLQKEVESLPPSQKKVVQLSYYENKDIPSICKQMNMSSNSAYVNYSRAVDTLKKKFQKRKDWLF